jgi:hypothetical protein
MHNQGATFLIAGPAFLNVHIIRDGRLAVAHVSGRLANSSIKHVPAEASPSVVLRLLATGGAFLPARQHRDLLQRNG